jgi:hypothetical protein
MLAPNRPTIVHLLRRAALWPILTGEKWLSSLGCQTKIEVEKWNYFLPFGGAFLDADKGSILNAD